MPVNFSQLMNARWLRRLSDLSQRHRTSLKYHLLAAARMRGFPAENERTAVHSEIVGSRSGPAMYHFRGSSDDKGLSRSVRVDDQFGRRCGSFCAGDEVDAALTGVQMLKPPARKNGSADSLVDICWATADL
jgi:hypothetical protein